MMIFLQEHSDHHQVRLVCSAPRRPETFIAHIEAAPCHGPGPSSTAALLSVSV